VVERLLLHQGDASARKALVAGKIDGDDDGSGWGLWKKGKKVTSTSQK